MADKVTLPSISTVLNSPTEASFMMSEQERLDWLHVMHMSLLNPSHDDLIMQHLAKVHASGRRSKVLDVGTGTGTWAVSLALRHPFADVIGIDINWSNFTNAHLPHGNVDFSTVDVTQTLPWTSFFDIVHVKSMLMDIPYYPQLIRRLSETLRPGGMIILIESELSYESVQGPPSSVVEAWSEALKRALAAKNTDVGLPRRLDTTVAATGFFSPQFFFQEIGCPVGAYMKGECMVQANLAFLLSLPYPFRTIDSTTFPESQTLLRAGQIQAHVLRTSLHRLVCNRIDHAERATLLSLGEACVQQLMAPDTPYLQRLFAVYAYKKAQPPTQAVTTHPGRAATSVASLVQS
ncbi:uncharacterized protein EHS24_007733 [Apiotrichum porosum]|uniref:Uncharacterized protein n=1 Tax=Apiotrichum porosum TaxID=105984 RepID=A0A427XV46_9TREE|nr:uncharacterized protein EHS24_007733 [Apiotrichum porosum]RSH82739.1 hypothetical protein EHS24_007733 [Apiotrichum porosum]